MPAISVARRLRIVELEVGVGVRFLEFCGFVARDARSVWREERSGDGLRRRQATAA